MAGYRYAVVVFSPEGDARVFGTYRDEERAVAFRERVNELVDKAWEVDVADDINVHYGRAHIRIVRRQGIRNAVTFAKEGR